MITNVSLLNVFVASVEGSHRMKSIGNLWHELGKVYPYESSTDRELKGKPLPLGCCPISLPSLALPLMIC